LLESEPGDRQGQPQPTPTSQSTFEPGADRLEQLADRAFAISPRLGALDGDSQDPLDDLLEDSLLKREQEREDEAADEAADAAEEKPLPEADMSAAGEPQLEPDVLAAWEEALPERDVPTAEAAPAATGNDTEKENVDTSAESSADTSYESDPSSPPISGGPPPRKRRT
jgi:hypothetical protein